MKHWCQALMFQNEDFETSVPGTSVSFLYYAKNCGIFRAWMLAYKYIRKISYFQYNLHYIPVSYNSHCIPVFNNLHYISVFTIHIAH